MGTLRTIRRNMARMLGVTFSGDRDLYQTLGYKKELLFHDYWQKYERNETAAAIIDRPAQRAWSAGVKIQENAEIEETAFEQAVQELMDSDSLNVLQRMQQADKLSRIGRYGVILLGFSDVTGVDGYLQPVTAQTGLKLLYMRAYSEESAQINQYETDPQNERYGMPHYYSIRATAGSSTDSLTVHYTRVIHVVPDPLNNDVYGTPELKAVFNRLEDLEKLLGGSAETYWQNARPGYAGTIAEDTELPEGVEEKIKEQIEEYQHGIRRFLFSQGMQLQSLTQQVSDPKNHVEVQVQQISVKTGIPKRVLMGSEAGELSSGQDKSQWDELVQDRRDNFAARSILRPFINRLMEVGVLPEVEDYQVEWPPLSAVDEKKQSEIALDKARTIKEYASEPMAQSIMTRRQFLKLVMALDEEEIGAVEEEELEMIQREQQAFDDDEDADPAEPTEE